MTWLQGLFSSIGLKRLLLAVLSVALLFAQSHPGLAFLVPLLTKLAGILGAVAVGHALASGTAGLSWVSAVAGLLQFAILVLNQVPAAAPYLPILQAIASILASYSAPTLLKAVRQSLYGGNGQ